MLPILLFNKFNNMEGSSNSLNNNPNNSFGQLYDDNVILNCVRSRKKVSELPNCPVCSCTIRQGELDSHLSLEVERLHKLSNGGSKRKLSVNSSGSGSNLALPGSSTSTDIPEEDVDVTGCPGGDVYLRINTNRLRRLRARRRCTPPPPQGQCPICNETVQTSRLQRHALRCLKRTGAPIDEDVPDTSSEEGSIDVENDADAPSVDDEPSGSGGPFGAEYQWCGEWRVRATALQAPAAGAATSVRRASHDQALVVDGDEDSELYGPPQYPPSAIAVDTELHSRIEDHAENGTEETNGEQEDEEEHLKPKGMVEASAETRIQALKAKIRDLEKKQNSSEAKCLICLGGYTSPAVSIQCWHVYCEVCWLQSLRAKKICPQCNAITTADHLRRIYM